MQAGEVFAGGLNLNFFSSMEFEYVDVTNADTPEELAKKVRNVLRLLMGGWREDWKTLLSHRVYQAVFLARDHELTKIMRLAFQQGFQHVFSQLEGRTLSTLEQNQAELFIANCLSYLPFADLSPYESIAIPQYVNRRWVMVDYKVTPIELTPRSGFKKLFLNDSDRVFAYGLEAINNADAEPHLLFMGTTYPAGQGFFSTIETDLEAFETVGKQLYRSGRASILKWINQQTKKTHVCGTSLGGALSLLLAIDQGDKISRVDALNPPGLYDPWRKSRFDHWDDIENKPPVYIQRQNDDQVSRFGIWKPDWHLIQVTAASDKKGPNSAFDHALNYAGFSNTSFVGVDAEQDNTERHTRNFLLYTFLRSAFYYIFVVPYRYLVVPLFRFLFSKAGLYTLAAAVIAVASIVFLPPLPAIIITAAVALPLITYLLSNLPNAIRIIMGTNQVNVPKSQDPNLPRNDELNIYAKDNEIEASFSYQEIYDYYYAERCVLKNKNYLPEEKPEENFKNTGLSKRAILEQVQNPERAQDKITITATKAKIHDMRKIVRIAGKIGLYASDSRVKLQEELSLSRTDYLMGKPLSIRVNE